MFGNILIDKIQCYFYLNAQDKEKASAVIKHIRAILSAHYQKNAYKVTLSRNLSEVHIWFTPTRYFDSKDDFLNYRDTNLDMPDEFKLLEIFEKLLLNEIIKNSIASFKITKIDLTKNLLMDTKPYYYLETLQNRIFPDGFKALPINSGYYNKTVSITTLARNAEKRDKTGDRELICYDKVAELESKHVYEIVLKTPLSKEEQNTEQIRLNYLKATNTLKLCNLNVLRLEWQFGNSKKISTISKFLKFDNSSDGLYVKDFINLMRKNKLYESLNDFYNFYTKSVLGGLEKKETKLSVYNQVLLDYYDKVSSLPLKNVMKENGLYCKFSHNMLKIQKYLNDNRIQEILNKISC